jgi:hypothetical protein
MGESGQLFRDPCKPPAANDRKLGHLRNCDKGIDFELRNRCVTGPADGYFGPRNLRIVGNQVGFHPAQNRLAGSRFIIVEQISGDEFLIELMDVIVSC